MKKLLVIFLITISVANEMSAMDNSNNHELNDFKRKIIRKIMSALDNSDNNELNEIKRKTLEFNAPDFSTEEAQKQYDNDLEILKQTLINLKKVNLTLPSLYPIALADYKESQEKVRNRFGQDIFAAPADDLDVQNMNQRYRDLQDIIAEEQRLRVFQKVVNVPVKYDRKRVQSEINEFKKPENRKEYFKNFRNKQLVEMSSSELERAILKNKMNRE